MDGRIRFGPFELDASKGQLRRDGGPLKVVGQPLEVLAMLVERPGEVVTREELRARLWQDDTFVDFDHGLNAAVNKLRAALGDSAESPRYVQTIPRRGYVFIGALDPEGPAPPQDPAASPTLPTGDRDRRLVALGAGALAVLVLVAGIALTDRGTPNESDGRVMLVVLPFENLSGDREQDYFAEGLTDEVITMLGQLNPDRLGVIARTSAASYREARPRIRQIADELGVDYVVEGSARRDGARVRVNVQLVRTADETHMWAQSYDREIQDLLAVQEDLARAVAERIGGLLPPDAAGQPTRRAHQPAPDVYEAYLRGRYLLGRRTWDAVTRGHEHLQAAVLRDPQFALGHAGLAQAYILLHAYRALPPAEVLPRAEQAALRSLELDPDLAEGHAVLGVIDCNYRWRWTEAERSFRRALQLNPNAVEARLNFALCLSHLGRLDEAVAEARSALGLDPVSLPAHARTGIVLYRARRYDEAAAQLLAAIELDPSYVLSYLNLGLVHAAQGRLDEAIAALEKGRSLDAESSDLGGLLAYALARAGRTDEARAVLQELMAKADIQFVQPYTLALIHLGLNEIDAALAWLERGHQEASWLTSLLQVAPDLDALRGHPRFEALLSQLQFPSQEP